MIGIKRYYIENEYGEFLVTAQDNGAQFSAEFSDAMLGSYREMAAIMRLLNVPFETTIKTHITED